MVVNFKIYALAMLMKDSRNGKQEHFQAEAIPASKKQ